MNTYNHKLRHFYLLKIRIVSGVYRSISCDERTDHCIMVLREELRWISGKNIWRGYRRQM